MGTLPDRLELAPELQRLRQSREARFERLHRQVRLFHSEVRLREGEMRWHQRWVEKDRASKRRGGGDLVAGTNVCPAQDERQTRVGRRGVGNLAQLDNGVCVVLGVDPREGAQLSGIRVASRRWGEHSQRPGHRPLEASARRLANHRHATLRRLVHDFFDDAALENVAWLRRRGRREADRLGRGRSIRHGTGADDDGDLPPQVRQHFTTGANHGMRHVVSGRKVGERNAERHIPDHPLIACRASRRCSRGRFELRAARRLRSRRD